jgi:hypothetical protein
MLSDVKCWIGPVDMLKVTGRRARSDVCCTKVRSGMSAGQVSVKCQ